MNSLRSPRLRVILFSRIAYAIVQSRNMKITSPILILLVLYCTSAMAAPKIAAPMTQRIARLEVGIQGVEAIRAIKRLQYAYGHYAEFGLWNDLADLFADKGTGHYPSGNLGKEAIRKLFLEDIGKGKL